MSSNHPQVPYLLGPLLLTILLPSFTRPAAATSEGGSWRQQAVQRIEQQEYEANPSALGLQAPNRAQSIRTCFREGGIEVVPRLINPNEEHWRFQWRTEAWWSVPPPMKTAAGRPAGPA